MIPKKLLSDIGVLTARGYDLVYEEEKDGSKIYLTFKKFPLPEDVYNLNETDLLIFALPDYPYTPFDMFWTEPELVLKDGSVPSRADRIQPRLGKNWRRFSYHPYQNHPWSPTDDDLATYVAYIQKRLHKGD